MTIDEAIERVQKALREGCHDDANFWMCSTYQRLVREIATLRHENGELAGRLSKLTGLKIGQETPRPKQDLLDLELKLAEAPVKPGSVWRHYRGNVYRVLNLAIDERTGSVVVVYRGHAKRGKHTPAVNFSRPLSEWTQTVEVDETCVPRYEEVGK